ncbi:MAG: nicotinate (nicotinamide) nucleotide adenylyltransferase [Dehalococcoidaceae bacterium]|nr:nicotinate (nicotinamide) nucleotide adenylyltransferase [Dehalococcoidaceae bacterium]
MKTGILGGTFDPPHTGHLEMAREAKAALGLERVLFMVAGQPQLKPNSNISPAADRLEMARLAIDGEEGFSVSAMEIERSGATYTADTLEELKRQDSVTDRYYFILGWDNLEKLKDWHQPLRIIENCYIVAIPRKGYALPDTEKLEKELPGILQCLFLLDKPVIDVSASSIRQKVRLSQDITGLVPEKVAGYIRERGLYKPNPL